MRLDLDLFKTVSELENVQQQQSLIETKQQEIDMSLDQMEVFSLKCFSIFSSQVFFSPFLRIIKYL